MEDGNRNSPYKALFVIFVVFSIGYFIFGKLDTTTQEIVMFVAEVFILTFDALCCLCVAVWLVYIIHITGFAKPLHDICTKFVNEKVLKSPI